MQKIDVLRSDGHSYREISNTLRNDAYTGNLTLQKTFRPDYICKTPRKNTGECTMYKAEQSHEAIISQKSFDAVQAEIARRASMWEHDAPKESVFTGMLVCANCGKKYRRRTVRRGHVWQCATYGVKGKSACASKQVPEDTLMQAAAAALGMPSFDADVFKSEIESVLVCSGNRLIFRFRDGSEKEIVWQDRSRRDSWTDEMKQKARLRYYADRNANSGDQG